MALMKITPSNPRCVTCSFFRQVLSPLGTFNCPVYRHQKHAQLSDSHAYDNIENFSGTMNSLEYLLNNFNATNECKEVTCLYNHVNWWIEDLISHPKKLEELEAAADTGDYFL